VTTCRLFLQSSSSLSGTREPGGHCPVIYRRGKGGKEGIIQVSGGIHRLSLRLILAGLHVYNTRTRMSNTVVVAAMTNALRKTRTSIRLREIGLDFLENLLDRNNDAPPHLFLATIIAQDRLFLFSWKERTFFPVFLFILHDMCITGKWYFSRLSSRNVNLTHVKIINQ